MTRETITVLDIDLVLPADNRDRLIEIVADYAGAQPADLNIHDALALLGLRGIEYTTSLQDGSDTTSDLSLISTRAPAQPWITVLICEHPDIFLTNDDVRAGDPYVVNAEVHFSAALHSSQIQDQTQLAGSVPFIVYRDNATDRQTLLLVRIDTVFNPGCDHSTTVEPGCDHSTTVERTVVTETFDPEAWYEPFIAHNGD